MKRITTILAAIFIQSCIPPSTNEIEKIDKPDNTKTKEFGIEITGQIIYQFYQKYGFLDVEEQLVLIVKPDHADQLSADLPFDSVDLKKITKIDARKFIKDQPVIFAPERTIQADIRLESKEYDSGEDKSVFHNQGSYEIIVTDSTESIFVLDNKTGLMYIESKK